MTAHIAKTAFKLNTPEGIVTYEAGQEVQAEHAEHWFAKAHIVESGEYDAGNSGLNVEELVEANNRLAADLAAALQENAELKAKLAKGGKKQAADLATAAEAPAEQAEAKKE